MPPSFSPNDEPCPGPSPIRDAGWARRLRLLGEAQGRPLDEAYLHQTIRADLEAEAAEASPDALVTPAMLGHLRELMAEKSGVGAPEVEEVPDGGPPRIPAAGPEMFCSTDTVVIVPGFLASALGDAGGRGLGLVWVSPMALATNLLGALQLGPYDGKEADLDPQVRIVPTGPLPILYDLLRLALEVRRYATEFFPIDWRKDLEVGARRLAARLLALGAGTRQVHLVAHSQGALVARRALQLLGPAESFRVVRNLILLGPANFGSFSAALALGGGHSLLAIARKLAVEPPQGFQQVLASMTGLYQLLPWDDKRVPWLKENSLGRGRFWRGGIDFARLDRFHGWGRDIDASFFDGQTTVILGDNFGEPTVGAVAYEGMTLRGEPEHDLAGDGTVPHACSVLPGVRTYLVPDSEHTMLCAHRGAIDAVIDVLAGRPVRLPDFPSDPAAHVGRASAARRGSTPEGAPAPAASATRPTAGGLNGAFLGTYDGRHSQTDHSAAARRARGEQLLGDPRRMELQATEAGLDARLPSFELILDASNLLPFDFLRTGDRLGRAVLKIQRADGAAGTGFLVAPGILLTNHHVLPDVATAASAKAVANYESSPADDPAGRPASARLVPKDLFVSNADLDFTFCAVEGLDYLGAVPLNRNSLSILRSEYVNIIQHPRGRPKEIVLQDNRVVRADNVVVQYSCDTEPGSSGSPVFNNQWKLVALHHASVVVDASDGRRAPDADPGSRYLNEGIRLSAIATWLETVEANEQGGRVVVARLRAAFQGLDPQIGFFGALGRQSRGKSAAEVVVESYRDDIEELDLAFWDLRSPSRTASDPLGEVARVVAEMRVDLWCFRHGGAETIRALCRRLETDFQLDYAAMIDPDGPRAGTAIVHRRDRALSVTRLDGEGPWGVTARVQTRRGEVVAFCVVPVGDGPGVTAHALMEAIGRRLASGSDPGTDWILMGQAGTLRVPLDVLAAAGQEPLVLISEEDGAIALLAGAGSPVAGAFATPNLDPVGDAPEFLEIIRDRELPGGVEVLGGPRPIALRLSIGGRKAPAAKPTPPATGGAGAPPPEAQAKATPAPPPPADIDDAILERKLRALLGPLIAQMLAGQAGPPAEG